MFDPGMEEIWREDVGENEEVLQQLAELKRLKEDKAKKKVLRAANVAEEGGELRWGSIGKPGPPARRPGLAWRRARGRSAREGSPGR